MNLWNQLDSEVQTIGSKDEFKERIKSILHYAFW